MQQAVEAFLKAYPGAKIKVPARILDYYDDIVVANTVPDSDVQHGNGSSRPYDNVPLPEDACHCSLIPGLAVSHRVHDHVVDMDAIERLYQFLPN